MSLFRKREIARKDERRIEKSIGPARFPINRAREGFDFATQPSVNKKQDRELATKRFIGNAEAVLLLGAQSVGRSISLSPLNATVLFTAAPTAVAQLAKAHSRGPVRGTGRLLRQAQVADRDELGYLPFEPDAAPFSFSLAHAERTRLHADHEQPLGRRMVAVFGDTVIATAILNRLLHRSHVITIRGDSYRLREKRRCGC